MVLTEDRLHGFVPNITTEAQVLTAMGESDYKRSDVSYRNIKGLNTVSYERGSYYFRDGKLLIISILPDERANSLSSDAESWLTALGKPNQEYIKSSFIYSEEGGFGLLYLYLDRGLALHVEGDFIGLVEIFPPMSLENYMKYFYKEPVRRNR